MRRAGLGDDVFHIERGHLATVELLVRGGDVIIEGMPLQKLLADPVLERFGEAGNRPYGFLECLCHGRIVPRDGSDFD